VFTKLLFIFISLVLLSEKLVPTKTKQKISRWMYIIQLLFVVEHEYIFSFSDKCIDIYRIDIVNSIYLYHFGDGQHLFPEPSIDRHGHCCDIISRGRKRVERERGDGLV
jgi:hypothetical protein